jgi:hypothetical protein
LPPTLHSPLLSLSPPTLLITTPPRPDCASVWRHRLLAHTPCTPTFVPGPCTPPLLPFPYTISLLPP